MENAGTNIINGSVDAYIDDIDTLYFGHTVSLGPGFNGAWLAKFDDAQGEETWHEAFVSLNDAKSYINNYHEDASSITWYAFEDDEYAMIARYDDE